MRIKLKLVKSGMSLTKPSIFIWTIKMQFIDKVDEPLSNSFIGSNIYAITQFNRIVEKILRYGWFRFIKQESCLVEFEGKEISYEKL